MSDGLLLCSGFPVVFGFAVLELKKSVSSVFSFFSHTLELIPPPLVGLDMAHMAANLLGRIGVLSSVGLQL